jgi:AcrR family transcriptional regulator
MGKFLRRPAERPEEILDAALARFATEGFAAARMEAIAADAGVTAGTIYRYFPSKDSLVDALVERAADPTWSRGREIADAYGARTAREILGLLLRRWVDHLDGPEPRQLLMVVVREAPRFPVATRKYVSLLTSPGCLALERALRHGIERGEFPLLEFESVAQGMAATVVGHAIWRATFGDHLPTAQIRGIPTELMLEAMIRGLPRTGDTIGPRPELVGPSAPHPEATTPPQGGLRIVTLTPPGDR